MWEFIALTLAGLGGIITAVVKTIQFVHEGELGVKLRFGKARRNKKGEVIIIKPGFILLIPFLESLKRRHVRQETLKFNEQGVILKDKFIFRVTAVVIFKVTDIYKALFEIEDLTESITDFCESQLRKFMVTKTLEDLSDSAKISEELLKAIEEKGAEWGVEFSFFNLTDCEPTSETAHLVMTETGAYLKVKALKSAAEDLGCKVSEIPPQLAACIIGVPLVTSIDQQYTDTIDQETEDEGDESGSKGASFRFQN